MVDSNARAPVRYIDLFAGIGGFHCGLDQCGGYKCVYSNEWDKYAAQIYKKHYGKCDTTDITKVKAGDIPDHDLLCAGFPCQAFSIAGKRKGFNDTRGTLFFEIARIAEQKRTPYLLLENVKGLLSHDEGRTFGRILETLDELGYDVQWQVLNSKNFGVPQKRERVFIIANLRGKRRSKVFPIRQGGDSDLEEITKKVSDAERIYSATGIAKTLKGLGGGLGAKTGLYDVRAVLTPDRENIRQRGRRIKENGEPSFTLTGQDVHGVAIDQGRGIRRLTPTECERLQGFPDGWTEGLSDTQRYKCLGNAVTTNTIQEIARLIAI